MFTCRYFLYHHRYPAFASQPEWQKPIPVGRVGVNESSSSSISYGEYFTAVHDFLTTDNGRHLVDALSQKLARVVTWTEIDRVDIIVQKHGAFYHPSRVEVFMRDETIPLVVNVAVSPEGKNGLSREFNLIRHLGETFPRHYLPVVYCQGEGRGKKESHRFPMFVGEWLTGYHEFHIHRGGDPDGNLSDDKNQSIRVWDPDKRVLLSIKQKRLLYRRAAEILTCYYNLETFEQIFPWHHGAGDFVVRLIDNEPDLRLITARGYSALVETGDRDLGSILEALLRFLLHLSMRTRIDRVDGIGGLVWADDMAVEGTLSGFFDGLDLKDRIGTLTETPGDLMRYYVSRLSPADLAGALEDILTAYPTQSPERWLMEVHLQDHAGTLFACLEAIE